MHAIDTFAARLHEHLSRAGISADQRPVWLAGVEGFDRDRAALILAGEDHDLDLDEVELIAAALRTSPLVLLTPHT